MRDGAFAKVVNHSSLMMMMMSAPLWNICVWSGGPRCAFPPAQARRDMLQNCLDDVGVVVDAELVGHGQEQRVGLGDGLILLQLIDQHVRLGGVAAAEDGAVGAAEEADLV